METVSSAVGSVTKKSMQWLKMKVLRVRVGAAEEIHFSNLPYGDWDSMTLMNSSTRLTNYLTNFHYLWWRLRNFSSLFFISAFSVWTSSCSRSRGRKWDRAHTSAAGQHILKTRQPLGLGLGNMGCWYHVMWHVHVHVHVLSSIHPLSYLVCSLEECLGGLLVSLCSMVRNTLWKCHLSITSYTYKQFIVLTQDFWLLNSPMSVWPIHPSPYALFCCIYCVSQDGLFEIVLKLCVSVNLLIPIDIKVVLQLNHWQLKILPSAALECCYRQAQLLDVKRFPWAVISRAPSCLRNLRNTHTCTCLTVFGFATL